MCSSKVGHRDDVFTAHAFSTVKPYVRRISAHRYADIYRILDIGRGPRDSARNAILHLFSLYAALPGHNPPIDSL
jgi:hypothetical protein